VEVATATTVYPYSGIYNVDSSGGVVALTMPDNAEAQGAIITVVRDGGNNVTIARAGADTFSDGTALLTLDTDNTAVQLISIGDTEWKILTPSTVSTGAGVDHDDLTNVTTDQHHAQSHTAASHSDQGATGAELETLTDGSNADALHAHAAIGGADHGGLGGLADIADHAYAALIDGTRDITGTQRYTGTPTPVIFGAAGDTQFSIVEDTDFFTINVGNNADVFLQRFVFFSSDHATAANDIQLRDGASAIALLWDNSLDQWRMFKALNVRDIFPETDLTFDLGSATATWVDVFADSLKDRAGVETYSIQTATFPTAHTFTAQARFTNAAVPIILGAAGDAQLEFLETADGWVIATGSNADVFTTRMTFQTADHADAHDIDLFTGAGGLTLRWDNSLDTFRFFKDISTTGSMEIDGALNHDGTTVGFYGTVPVVQSAAYTPTNVTPDRAYDANATGVDELADVLGTLIADLQLTGLIG